MTSINKKNAHISLFEIVTTGKPKIYFYCAYFGLETELNWKLTFKLYFITYDLFLTISHYNINHIHKKS